ncbi:hypothetical protein LTR53_009062 [Teratosphaeriaceae sp. CCFEE 6253]|nr:hypothetical protein LTR53_009062 [Teratosphaeriaceae sp. CCFEE 6253]
MRLSTLLLLPAALRTAVLAYTPLSNTSLHALPAPSPADFNIHAGGLLAPILVPRVPGTPGSEKVLRHFVKFFSTQLPDWRLEFQNSTSTTPTSHGKEVPFRNLIATRDPPWLSSDDENGSKGEGGEVGRLALVAHYDSKLTPHNFIGATDSAAPCAILLHVARSIDAALTRKWAAMESNGGAIDSLDDDDVNKGIQIILLDGEEAFDTWTHTDSIYGARSLAAAWESTPHPALSTYKTPLDSIALFVLLDLLGAANPRVPSYFKTTHWAYQLLASVETRLRSLADSPLKSNPANPFLPEADKDQRGATERWLGGYIEDDHLPFMARGVEILHLIPSPFPMVWHTMADDGAHLDGSTVEDWAAVMGVFAAEWMDLEGFIEGEGGAEQVREEGGKGKGRDEL